MHENEPLDEPGREFDKSRPVPFKLGDWLVRPTLNQLSAQGEKVHLEPKVMEVLLCLAEAQGRVVTKEEFMDRVWTGTVVTNDVLSRCISELRKIFGEDASNPRYIETIRKSGYRLLMPVVYEAPEPATTQPASTVNAEFWQRSSTPDSLPKRWAGWPHKRSLVGSLVGGVVVTILILVFQAIFADSGAPSQAVPFTTFPGEEVDPELSPDGNAIAFSWNGGSGEDFDLYIKHVGGETPLRLTEAPGDERNPTWSADGKQIAFLRNLEGNSSVYIVPSLGGSERLVAEFVQRQVQDLIWSPSGSFLAVSATTTPYGAYSIFLLTVETLQVHTLTQPPLYFYGDTSPAFSPDEKEIAFVRGITAMVQDIHTVSIDGDDLKRLTFDHARISGIDWDPGANSILFASDRDGASNLWRIAASGGRVEWIVSAGDNADVGQPSMSAGGSRLLTFERRFSNTNIWKLKRSEAPQRFISSTRWDSNPSISPDGSRIAFVSNQSGNHELWICDADGQNQLQLTSLKDGFLSMPSWSPDGSRIAFISWQEENADVYIIDALGGSPRKLLDSPADEVSPRWSNDGRSLYFASNMNDRWQVWRASPQQQDSTQQMADSTQMILDGAIAAMETEDGSSLLFVKQNEPGLWQLSADADSSIQLISSLLPKDKDNWSVVGRGVYFIRRDATRPALAYYSMTTGRTTQIAVFDHLPDDHSFAASPDGMWFLYAQEENRESDILLLEDVQ